jgi:hypothetical protein
MSLTKVTYSMIDGQFVNAADFGATGDGTTNDTAALNAAYAAADASKQNLYIPPGNYIFTSQLLWNKNVSVCGQREFTNLRKSGNFDGILITASAAGCTFDSFNVLGQPGNGGSGIVIRGTSYINVQNIFSSSHAVDGIYIDNTLATGTIGTFNAVFLNVNCSSNGRDGIGIDGTGPGTSGDPTNICNVCNFQTVLCNSNGNYGFRQYGNNQAGYHYGFGIDAEGNDVGGVLIEGIANFLSMYVEANTSTGLNLSSTSERNVIVLTHEDTVPFRDSGTNNTIMGGGFAGLRTANIAAPSNPSNVAGRDLVIGAASSLAATSAFKGGDLLLFGGDASGTTSTATGGRVRIQGGTPIGGDLYGAVVMQPSGGGVTVGAETTPPASVLMRFESTTKAVQYVGITTTQRNLLTAVAGMVIFNSSTSKLQVYDGANWVDLH